MIGNHLYLRGLAYGVGLSLLGALVAGSGHGTYILLGLASSPLAALGNVAATLSPPFIWAFIWSLLQVRRQMFLATMAIHYVSAAVVLVATHFGDWEHLGKSWKLHPLLVVIGFAWYATGQGLIWLDFRRCDRRPVDEPFSGIAR
jgi:hypothetical protein